MPKRTKLFIAAIIVGIYFVFIAFYCFFEQSNQIGLYSQLISWQLQLFGVSYKELAIILEMGLLLSPTFPLTSYIQKNKNFFISHGTADTFNRETFVFFHKEHITYYIVGAAILGMFAIAYSTMNKQLTVLDSSQKIFHLDITENAVIPDAQAKLVTIKGYAQNGYRLVYKEKSQNLSQQYTYIPLTQKSWNKSQPVHYIIANETREDYGSDFPEKPSSKAYSYEYSGILNKTSLPGYIKDEFERKGIIMAADYYVLEETPLCYDENCYSNGLSSISYTFSFFALFVIFVGIVFFIAVKIGLQRKNKKSKSGKH